MISKGRAESSGQVYQLKVTLDGFAPPIWRRLLVPGDINLLELHEVLQVAMGWTDSHLHQFVVEGTFYGLPNPDLDLEHPTIDERERTIHQVVEKKGRFIVYEYDFGDCWEHLINVEEVRPSDGKRVHPQCLDGARHRPPENVGGIPGYENFLAAIKDPKHPEHGELLEWAGGSFDPEEFSVEDVNQGLEMLRKAGSLEVLWPPEE